MYFKRFFQIMHVFGDKSLPLYLALTLLCGAALGQDRITAVWHSGSDHKLWTNADIASFLAKDQELGLQNYMLEDVEVSFLNGQPRFTGFWLPGTGRSFLRVSMDWNTLQSTWNEAKNQGQRLVDIEVYFEGGQQRFAGIWHTGENDHKLVVDVGLAQFVDLDNKYHNQGFQLVDIETYLNKGRREFAGVWHQNRLDYIVQIGLGWTEFNNLRVRMENDAYKLVDVERYSDGGAFKYAGVWHPGTTRQKIYADAQRDDFMKKWSSFKSQNLILADIEISSTTSSQIAASSTGSGSSGASSGGSGSDISRGSDDRLTAPLLGQGLDNNSGGAPADPRAGSSSGNGGGGETTGEVQMGKASYYSDRFQGSKTASGELYDRAKYTAAHRTLKFGTKIRVTNLANDKSVVVAVNDRGPFKPERVVDLSYIAAEEIGAIQSGIIDVKVEVLK